MQFILCSAAISLKTFEFISQYFVTYWVSKQPFSREQNGQFGSVCPFALLEKLHVFKPFCFRGNPRFLNCPACPAACKNWANRSAVFIQWQFMSTFQIHCPRSSAVDRWRSSESFKMKPEAAERSVEVTFCRQSLLKIYCKQCCLVWSTPFCLFRGKLSFIFQKLSLTKTLSPLLAPLQHFRICDFIP